MTGNPITKKITRHIHGYWRGAPGLNVHHPPVWTVGHLQKMLDDIRAAGYGDDTELKAEIARDTSGLNGFRLSIDEQIAQEVVTAAVQS